jgi:flagellar motility protein MotE (MotC chaperone)
MIGKLLRGLISLVIYLCVATVLAEGILLVWYARAWQVDRDRLVRMFAAAQGVDLETVKEQAAAERPEPSTEQPSYDQVLEARAVKARNLELREQALRGSLGQLQSEQRKLADEKKRVQQLREGFQNELLAMQKGATATGREDVRRTLETLKPKQAKELLALMLKKKELDEVVTLMSGMTDAKRAKIIAEFKAPEEAEQLSEVLRRIREGLPNAAMAENTQKQLEPPKGPGT